MAVNIPAPARRRSGALLALVLAALCAACENGITPPKTDNAVAAVAVTAPAATLQNGSSMQLSAAASNAAGQPLAGKAFAWASSSDAVATVAADGTVTGKSTGAVTVTATSEGKSGTVELTITPVPIATVSVNPDTATVVVGAARQLAAVGRDASGGVLTGRLVAWASADSMIARVGPTGLVTARAAGSVVVTATSEGKSGTATITVVPVPIATVMVSPDTATLLVGATRQLAAVAWDASGAPLTGRPVSWSSADSMIARVSPLGLVTARAAGSAVITATSEGKSGTATITVVPIPIATVTVSPDTATLTLGATRQLAAVAWDASGMPLTGRPVSWSSADPEIASVSATGLVTARGGGTAVIIATSEGKSGTATITVRTTGTLRINFTSQGDLPDPDGYEILYNGRPLGKFGGSGGMEVDELQPGEYTVAIRSVSLYCSVNGSRDRTVTLAAGGTAVVDFVVLCRRDGMAYQVWNGTAASIFVHFPGRDAVTIPTTSIVSSSRMRWSPDGRRLLYSWAPPGGSSGPTYVDLDSLRMVRIPVNGIHPDPSPDGTRIAYVSGRTIRTARWDGSDEVTVWQSSSTSIFPGMPTWSPDGSQIAFTKNDFSTGIATVSMVNADGTGERVVRTLRTRPYLHIDWSPDGGRVVYPDQPAGSPYAIYTANVATGAETRLIGTTGVDYHHPEYLRDGRIGFISQPQGGGPSRIWTVNADGTGLTERVIPGVTAASLPAWQ